MKRTWKMISGVCLMGALTVLAAMPAAAETIATETAALETTAMPAAETSNSGETTTQSNESATYSVVVSVQDKDTHLPLDDVDVCLEKRYYEDIPDKNSWECFTGESEVLAKWNTSDANPYTSADFPAADDKPFAVVAVISELPAGYSYYGREIAEYAIWAEDFSVFDEPFSIALNLQKEKYMGMDFPITGTYTETISFADAATGAPIENLDCVLVNTVTGEELFAWNTSELPSAEISGLEYCFTDWHMNAEFKYAVKFKNLPENYVVFNGKSRELVYLLYSPTQLESGETAFETQILMENTDPDAPPVTYISSNNTDGQTTTTRETTVTTTAAPETATTTETTETETTTTETETTVTTETTVWADYTSAPVSETTETAESDLPQTGNNSLNQIALILGALLMLSTGAWAVHSAGSLRRKDETA